MPKYVITTLLLIICSSVCYGANTVSCNSDKKYRFIRSPCILLEIDGKLGKFLVDTSVPTTMVSREFYLKNFLNVYLYPYGQKADFPLFVLDKKFSFHIDGKSLGYFSLSAKNFGSDIPPEIDGILGYDILKKFNFSIHLQSGNIFINETYKSNRKIKLQTATIFTIPNVKVYIDGKPLWMKVSLGTESTEIYNNQHEDLQNNVNNEDNLKQHRPENIAYANMLIGKDLFKNEKIVISNNANSLGIDLLSKFDIFYDSKKQSFYLSKPITN